MATTAPGAAGANLSGQDNTGSSSSNTDVKTDKSKSSSTCTKRPPPVLSRQVFMECGGNNKIAKKPANPVKGGFAPTDHVQLHAMLKMCMTGYGEGTDNLSDDFYHLGEKIFNLVHDKSLETILTWGNCYNLINCPVPEGQGEGKIGSMNSWDISRVTYLGCMEYCEHANEAEKYCSKDDSPGFFEEFAFYRKNLQGTMAKEAFFFADDISDWDVSNVKTMNNLFKKFEHFNGDLSKWDVSSLEDMREMFRGAVNFNSDISKWQLNLKQWEIIENSPGQKEKKISLSGLDQTFRNALSFNRDLSKWNVKNLKTAYATFYMGTGLEPQSTLLTKSEDDSFVFYKAAEFYEDGIEIKVAAAGLPYPLLKMGRGALNVEFCSSDWLKLYNGFNSIDVTIKKVNQMDLTTIQAFSANTALKIMCCDKGQQLEFFGSTRKDSRPSQAKCVDCSIGLYNDQLHQLPHACKSCNVGQASIDPTSTCNTCAVGQFQDLVLNRASYGCKNCLPGKASEPGAERCGCPVGNYMLNATSEDCIGCSKGMNCSNLGTVLATIRTEPGYWREHNQTDAFYRCKHSSDCVGGLVENQCEKNRGGTMCTVCFDQHVRVGADCIACPPGQGRGGNSSIGIIVGFTPCIVLFAVLVYYFARREKKKEIKPKIKKKDTKVAPVQNTASTVSVLAASAAASVGDAAQKVVEEESQNQTITNSLMDKAEESQDMVEEGAMDAIAVVEEGAMDAIAEASGDTTAGKISAKTDRAMQENIMHEAEAALADMSSRVSGRLRILVGFVQIIAGMASGFTIPWPPMFLSLINFVTFINFDFVGLLGGLDACSLYSPFLTSAAFHMAVLPLFAMMVVAAATVARCCLRNDASVVSKRAKGIMLELMMLLYPGIVTKCFTTFKCKTIAEVSYLVADYGVKCDPTEGEWAMISSTIMVPAMIVYVLGIPLGIAGFLYVNKKWLFGGDTPRAKSFQDIYGSLYEAYEPSYWYFESVVLIQKALLTGGLVLVAPGSSAQILVGLVVALMFYTLVLDGKPYEADVEDRMQTMATASTVMTLLIGFTLKLTSDKAVAQEQAAGVQGDYDTAILDVVLIVLFFFVTVSGFAMTVMSCPCFASMCKSKKEKEKE